MIDAATPLEARISRSRIALVDAVFEPVYVLGWKQLGELHTVLANRIQIRVNRMVNEIAPERLFNVESVQ